MATTPTNPLLSGLIGKEFLFDENLFITNFNPFDTRNTAGLFPTGNSTNEPSLAGLKNQTTITGKLLVFDTLNYDEDKLKPVDTGLRNTKTLSDILAIPGFKRSPTESTPYNQFSIQLSLLYEDPTDISQTGTRRLKMSLTDSGNSQLNIFPQFGANISGPTGVGADSLIYNQENIINISDEISPTNKARMFCIFQIDKNTDSTKSNSKAYTDITENDSGNLYRFWYIPSEAICLLGNEDQLPPEQLNNPYNKLYLRLIAGTGISQISSLKNIILGQTNEDSRNIIPGFSIDTGTLFRNNTFIKSTPETSIPDALNFSLDSTLPFHYSVGTSLVIKGYVYCFPQRNYSNVATGSTAYSNIVPKRNKLNSDGSLSATWEDVTGIFPSNFNSARFFQVGNYLFVLGGLIAVSGTSTSSTTNCYYCEISENGDLGTLIKIKDLPATFGAYCENVHVVNSRVYLVSGSDIFIGSFVNKNGQFDPSSLQFNVYTQSPGVYTRNSWVYGNRLFVVGSNTTTVGSYLIDSITGEVSNYRVEASLPAATLYYVTLLLGNKVWCIAYTTSAQKIYVADLSTVQKPEETGTGTYNIILSSWRLANTLDFATFTGTSFIAGKYIYTADLGNKLYKYDISNYITEEQKMTIDYTDYTYTNGTIIEKPFEQVSLVNTMVPKVDSISNSLTAISQSKNIKEAEGFNSITLELKHTFGTEEVIGAGIENEFQPKPEAVLELIKNLKVNSYIKDIQTRLIYATTPLDTPLNLTNTVEDLNSFLMDPNNIETILEAIDLNNRVWKLTIVLHKPILKLLSYNGKYQTLTNSEILDSIENKIEKSKAQLNTLDILGDGSCFAAYRFNGDALNLSGNVVGTAPVVGTATVWSDEPFGKCANFTGGSESYINLSGAASTLMSGFGGQNTKTWTMSFWVSIDSGNFVLGRGIVGESIATNEDKITVFPNYIRLFRETGAGTDNSYSYYSKDNFSGNWNNIICNFTNNGSTNVLEIFLNGISLGIQTIVSSDSTAPNFYLGYVSGIYYQGKVAQLRFFNKNLNIEEIKIVSNELIPFIGKETGSFQKYGTDLIPNTKNYTILTNSANPANLTKLISVNGKYKIDSYEKFDLLNVENSIKEGPTLTTAQRGGPLFYTGTNDYNNGYVYLYGGVADTSTSRSYTISNTLWRSKVLNDGTLEGFIQIGTNDLKLIYSTTYLIGGYVYMFGGFTMTGTAASVNSINTIRRAKILLPGDSGVTVDTPELIGTIGAWEICGALPIKATSPKITNNPENPNIIYISGYNSIINGTSYPAGNYVSTYKFSEPGSTEFQDPISSLQLLYHNNISSGVSLNFYNVSTLCIKNNTNETFLYFFGQTYNIEDLGIYRIRIGNDYCPISGIQKVGKLDKIRTGAKIFETKENIFLIGGYASTTNYKYGGSDTIIYYDKNELFNIGYEEALGADFIPITYKTSSVKFPLAVTDLLSIKTNKGYFIYPNFYTTVLSGSYSWATTPRTFYIETSFVDINSTNLKIENIDTKLELNKNIKLNKIAYRPIEELYTNLFVKGAQTLTAYGETIKFVNPENTDIGWEIEEMVKPVALPRFANIFLKWIEELSRTNSLNNYNNYRYVNNAIDSEKLYSVLIPELIFNILGTEKLYNLNKSIFKNYLLTNPPSAELDPNGIITEQFIDEVLYAFYKCKVTSSNYVNLKSSLIYNANGLVVPDLTKINFSSKNLNYGFIFFPQRHNKYLENSKMITPSFLSGTQTYLDNISGLQSSLVVPKDPNAISVDGFADGTNINDLIKFGSFDYYISPTGSDTNSGRDIRFPKATLSGLSNSKILLLPGIYESLQTDQRYHRIFTGMGGGNIIYGCGDLTIIDRTATTYIDSSRDKHIAGEVGTGTTTYFRNFTVKYDDDGRTNYNSEYYQCALFAGGKFDVKNVNFQITGYYSLIYARSYTTSPIIYSNCTFTGGTRGAYYSGQPTINTSVNDEFQTYFLNLTQEKVDNIIKNSSPIIETEYSTFTPMYTLLPLGDNEIDAEIISETDVEDKNIILDFTTNITDIKNLSVKL